MTKCGSFEYGKELSLIRSISRSVNLFFGFDRKEIRMLKRTIRILGILLIVSIVLCMGIMSSFAEDSATGTGTLTIHPPEGISADAESSYKIYKVFEAVGDGTAISYRLVEGKTTAPDGFTVDAGGNVSYAGTENATELTEADITAIKLYVTDSDLVATADAMGNTATRVEGLPNGYYYITTSTGSVVMINSANPNADIYDKNSVPTVEKIITRADSISDNGKKALAQIGTDVEYTATVTLTKSSKNVVFHDVMYSGLVFKGNDYVTVTGIDAADYTLKAEPDEGDTITVSFGDDLSKNTTVTIKYLATVIANAQTKLENIAKLTYGSKNTSTVETRTEVYNAQITVLKQDGKNTEETSDDTALGGAGFVLARDVAGSEAEGTEGQDGYVPAVDAHREYYKLTENVVSWVTDIDQADVHTSSGEDGTVPAFTGLASGNYILVEKITPAGFNTAADTEITIASDNYTEQNLSRNTVVINQSGTELPSTGGVGTTIFYVVGSILVVAAVVLLITKKRMSRGG